MITLIQPCLYHFPSYETMEWHILWIFRGNLHIMMPRWVRVMVFNAILNNISVILWRTVLLVEETGIPGENHWPVVSHRQTLSHNVVSSTSSLSGMRTRNISAGVKKSSSPTSGASNFHIWAGWNNQLYARRASKKKYWILTNLSIFTYLLIFIYVICCLISSNVLFIQPLAFCRNWEQRR